MPAFDTHGMSYASGTEYSLVAADQPKDSVGISET